MPPDAEAGARKVRPGITVQLAGVDHAQGFAQGGGQLVLVVQAALPDMLQQVLREEGVNNRHKIVLQSVNKLQHFFKKIEIHPPYLENWRFYRYLCAQFLNITYPERQRVLALRSLSNQFRRQAEKRC
jgi:hypothetical protein